LILAINTESVSVTDRGLLAIGAHETYKPAVPVSCIIFQSTGRPIRLNFSSRAWWPFAFGHQILTICLLPIQHLYPPQNHYSSDVWTTCPKS